MTEFPIITNPQNPLGNLVWPRLPSSSSRCWIHNRTQAKPQPPPDGPFTPAETARKLRCSPKTLNGHVASGALRYVAVGHGTKRTRRMFTAADINDFIASKTRKDVPCPSAATRARRSGNTDSKSEVVSFSALQKRRRNATPKK